MPDVEAAVQNITGKSDNVDAYDGSGLTSPFLSFMQNESLIDAAVGEDKKTIYHDINSQWGTPVLLKWAEYVITNESRRNAVGLNLENLFRKMHSLQIPPIQFNRNLEDANMYFKRGGRYYKIKSISINGNEATRELIEVNENGVEINENLPVENMPANNIYNLHELFGGAWFMQFKDNIGKLNFSEENLKPVFDIICDNDIKDRMIGWVVNKSAIKVGAINTNEKSA